MAGVRRTWNKEEYEAKAKRRLEMGENEEQLESSNKSISSTTITTITTREEFIPAPEDAKRVEGSERAFLKAREHSLDLDSKVGKTQVVAPSEIESGSAAPGWYCEVCKCLLKDSTSYLDHINGKKHQRALGYSMRVERAGVDRVKERLDSLKRKISDNKNGAGKPSAIEEYESRAALLKIEEENRKKKKREEIAARKREEELAELDAGIDPDIATLMGFGSFGGNSKKN